MDTRKHHERFPAVSDGISAGDDPVLLDSAEGLAVISARHSEQVVPKKTTIESNEL